ncbi:hypothetical protein QKT49_gp128 [Acanthamoeba castellanii medusavirus]|uniref:Uncharacterized protein n=1 Tax=Acanthamoeba castellanii medusavirus J1 TaxID=3114988 RepID=A0A3T1CWS3_9VIRU|nr:hypothetical protein QKT49_gp128 [Acanthamoeba castellanii medusavirus]BBI30268.1 hypothetical protein [Acanthamoeba castellanii medusavirus J1]
MASHSRRTVTPIAGDYVESVTNNGFPLESMPPQGSIELHFHSGLTIRCRGTPRTYDEMVRVHRIDKPDEPRLRSPHLSKHVASIAYFASDRKAHIYYADMSWEHRHMSPQAAKELALQFQAPIDVYDE